MRRLFPGFREWRDHEKPLKAADLIAAYESGCAGTWIDHEAKAEFRQVIKDMGGQVFGSEAAHAFGLAESGAGKLSVPFVHVMEQWPGAWPGPAQVGPDCVSHDTRNAILGSWTCELVSGKVDEVTGRFEGKPEVSPTGIANGVLATETYYAERGWRGGGANCNTLATAAVRKVGLVLRANYPEAGVDLTKYNYSWGANLGGRGVPEVMANIGRQHLIRTATELEGWQQWRDFLANGYFLSTCGSESWSSNRDENGYSPRTRKGWAHALAEIAFDDRPVIRKLYGEPLVAILNSWAVWNGGPRDIIDSAQYVPPSKRALWIKLDIVNPATGNIMLPKGAWWARVSEAKNRYVCALSSVNGWPRRDLLDYGSTGRV